MGNFNRAARVIAVIATSVLAVAQTQTTPAKPSPQQRPAASAPSKAVAPAPQQASPDSKRFVTNENFFRAGTKSQPATSAPSGSQPAAQTSSTPTASPVVRPNNLLTAPTQQPAVTPAVAAVVVPQPAPAQPAVTTSPSVADHDASAAVDYASGQLTVVAERAPLGHVLKLIGGKTGAVIDVAPELQQELVAAKLGPAPVREVLTELLASPRVDFIVFGTGDEPGGLQRIVVRRRQSFGSLAMGPARSPQPVALGDQADPNGRVISKRNIPGQAEMTQDQRMEEWNKARAQMLEAEMKQQAQERENEKYQEQPAPQDPPQQQDNPPQI